MHADRVTTTEGDVPAAITVWTTGFAVHPIARATALETGDTGQIVVDATMRSTSHPDVYAIGDAALVAGPGGKPLRMSCASGIPTAWQAADDRAISAALTGRVAALYKELVCKGAAWGVANPTMGLPARRRRVTTEPARVTATAA